MATSSKQARISSQPKPMLPSSDTTTDALDRLKTDHRHIEALFERYETASGSARKPIIKTICEELTVHAELEEMYFYPVARDALTGEQHLVHKAIVEHSVLKWLAEQLANENPESVLYDAKVKVLKELVIRHARDEEKVLFPKVGCLLPYRLEFSEMLSDARLDVRNDLEVRNEMAH